MQTEDRIQADCYKWFHNSYPHLRGLLCYNLGNSKNAIQGAKNKAMGIQPGRSDMTLYYSGRAFLIEFKTIQGTQSPAQIKWQQLVIQQGFVYKIIRSLEDFQQFLLPLLGAPTPTHDHRNQAAD